MTDPTLLITLPRDPETPCTTPDGQHAWRPVAVHVNYAQRLCGTCHSSEHSSRAAPGAAWSPWIPTNPNNIG